MPDTPSADHVMSLHSRWAQAIYAGNKTWEFRRGAPRMQAGETVLIYETQPRGEVTGRCEVADVIEAGPEQLAQLELNPDAREHLRSYLAGAQRCCAFRLTGVERFAQPLALSQLGLARGPMSYQRLAAPRPTLGAVDAPEATPTCVRSASPARPSR